MTKKPTLCGHVYCLLTCWGIFFNVVEPKKSTTTTTTTTPPQQKAHTFSTMFTKVGQADFKITGRASL